MSGSNKTLLIWADQNRSVDMSGDEKKTGGQK